MRQLIGSICLTGLLLACGEREASAPVSTPSAEPAIAGAGEIEESAHAIDAGTLSESIRILASDEFLGRKPGGPGEALTLAFLQRNFRALGLKPVHGDSFLQDVPLLAITPRSDPRFAIITSDRRFDLGYRNAQVTVSRRTEPELTIDDSALVFAGYGVNAPERGWNDYQGIDVRGKTVLLLINDPGFHTGDETLFDGRAMTRYGRWDYKYAEAARQGAAGAIIIHDTEGATYPWRTVENSWSGTKLILRPQGDEPTPLAFESWITQQSARELLAAAGNDFDTLLNAANTPGFRARPIAARVSARIENGFEQMTSHNVAALLPGSTHPEEVFVYSSHWDHIGTDAAATPGTDSIFNGAFDNASGTAGLIELARAFASLPTPPRRSVLFLAVTAEEQGLLGSAWYAAHPLIPLAQTVAGLNMDGINVMAPTREIRLVGMGNSALDAWMSAALPPDRVLSPDPTPEQGSYFRSDQYSFALAGVPMLFPKPGIDHLQRGDSYGREWLRAYYADRYHGAADEWSAQWNLDGAVADLRVFFRTGLALANSSQWPGWAPGSEFQAARTAMGR